MAKEEAIEIDGIVEDVLPNSTFRVHLPNGHFVLATIAGKMRRFRIRVLAGDSVTIPASPYNHTRAGEHADPEEPNLARELGRAHVRTPVTRTSRTQPSACTKKQ